MVATVRTSISGMRAATRALGVAASNTVNANDSLNPQDSVVLSAAGGRQSGGQEDAPLDNFVPQRVDNVTAPGGGVSAVVRPVHPPFVIGFNPADPNADGDGMVAWANVDAGAEMLAMKQAENLYRANALVLETEGKLLGMLVNDQV